MMVGNNLKETQLQQIVDKTILFADKDGDGKISFEEFCDVVGNTDVHKKMVVDVWIIFHLFYHLGSLQDLHHYISDTFIF